MEAYGAHRTLFIIGYSIIILALVAAGIGLFYDDGGEPYTTLNHLGEEVEIYGKGLYANDSILIGAANQGTDAIVLLVGIPLLVFSLYLIAKDERRGSVLMAGALTYFLYVYATFSLSIAFNRLFIVYVALFALSLYGLMICVFRIKEMNDASPLVKTNGKGWIGYLMIILGSFTGLAWGVEPLMALLTGDLPNLTIYPTLFTHAFDMAIIVPISVISGIWILRGKDEGYLVAVPVIMLLVMVALSIISMTVSQYSVGLQFSVQELMVFVVSFIIFGLVGVKALKDIFSMLE